MVYTGHGTRKKPNTRIKTPQNQPVPNSTQVLNNTGVGYSWTTDDMTQLRRFLILGSAGGSYYVGEQELTRENLDVVERLIKAGEGVRVVHEITDISTAKRAISNDPALFALARVCASDQYPRETYTNKKGEVRERVHPADIATMREAYAAIPAVARTGTDILHLTTFSDQFKGRGTGFNRAIARWYSEKSAQKLSYQAVKYQQRDGRAQRDELRLTHVKPRDDGQNALYHWMTKGWEGTPDTVPEEAALALPYAYEQAKRAKTAEDVARLITTYRLPHECVPTQFKKEAVVWKALLADMPLSAMLRNLANMTRYGVFAPMSDEVATVVARLRNPEWVRRAGLHPMKVLVASQIYASGKSPSSGETWTPVHAISDALSEAFYAAFACVEPTGKRILFGVDVSGSMTHKQAFSRDRKRHKEYSAGISCHMAASALAMVLARRETHSYTIAFDTSEHRFPVSAQDRLDTVCAKLRGFGGGGTDWGIPFRYAMSEKLIVDAFVTISDGETWAGNWQCAQLLEEYRRRFNPEARIINVQMAPTRVTNIDPNDTHALEVVGFDTSVPEIISEFVRGEV